MWPEVTTEYHEALRRAGEHEVERFEAEATEVLDIAYAISTASHSVAITVVLAALGCGVDDRVAVPAFSFAGTATPALRLGAKLRFADVDPSSFVVPAYGWPGAEFVIPTHHGGYLSPSPETTGFVIDDSREAPFVQTVESAATCVSLDGGQMLWGGEGGLILTDSESLADVCRGLRDGDEAWKLPAMAATLGRVSLSHLEERENHSQFVATLFARALDGSHTALAPSGFHLGYHRYRLRLLGDWSPERAIEVLAAHDVMASRGRASVLPEAPEYQSYGEKRYPGAASVAARTVVLGDDQHPIHSLSTGEAERWAEVLAEVFP